MAFFLISLFFILIFCNCSFFLSCFLLGCLLVNVKYGTIRMFLCESSFINKTHVHERLGTPTNVHLGIPTNAQILTRHIKSTIAQKKIPIETLCYSLLCNTNAALKCSS